MRAFILLTALAAAQAAEPLARFHHLHLNTTDPQAAIEFYTTHFAAEKGKFAGAMDAVWAQKSWILFTKVNQPPPSEILSGLYHFGWGAEDMKAAYQKQLDIGAKFQTPISDLYDGTGWGKPGAFYYAYVDGPDHAMIEINTSANHNFGHIHMLSEDPIATGEWYIKEFGMTPRGQWPPSRQPYSYKGVQLAPSASLVFDNVNFIIFPIGFIKTLEPKNWETRTSFEPTQGRVMDHFGLSVDNLDETIARLKKDGVKVTSEPRAVLQGKLKIAFIEGPDRVRIELVEGHAKKE